MQITVNGQDRQCPEGQPLSELLEHMQRAHRGIAVALDGEVVHRGDWARTTLQEGAQVEVLTAVQGG